MALTMTAQWVERLKPPTSSRVEYFDDKVVGLVLRVTSKGKKTWYVMYRVKGDPTRRRTSLGDYPGISLADAREKATRVLIDASTGVDQGKKKREELSAPTFGELAALYIERYAKPKKRTWERDQELLERNVLPSWNKRKAHDIKRRDVITLLDAIVDRGAPIAANRTLAVIRKLFNWAISRDILDNNACSQVSAPSKENERERVLSDDEIRAVWKAFEVLSFEMRAMFQIRLYTAQRGVEVETMRWQDIDLDGRWWTIPAEVAKNGLSHRVPLTQPVIKILLDVRARNTSAEWAFVNPRTKSPIRNIQKAADKVEAVSGVDFVMHDLRRTAASNMTSSGIPRLVVSKVLNHVEQGVTRVYDRHSYDQEKRQALEVWGQKLSNILSKG